MNRYVSALAREIELVAPDLNPRTVFFGGGTPSLLNLGQWEQIVRTMDRSRLLGAEEWTVECNPATVSFDKARWLRSHGVNRISMGVQSLDDQLLRRLGRIHTPEMVFKSFDTLRRAGFENINVDLMFAIPGQTMEMWEATLTEALALNSEHLSCYEVIYEEDTPLFEQLKAGQFSADEDLACAMYETLIERAAKAGFTQYEVANFARDDRACEEDCHHRFKDARRGEAPAATAAARRFVPRFACKHNVNYWRGGSFYGLGPSATSYVRGVRTKNWSNTQLYCERLEHGKRAIESSEKLTPVARAGETAAFGLRMLAGWPYDEFQRTTGHDLRRDWAGEMNDLARQGWASITPERFQLTREGLRFADAAAQLFLR